MAKDPSQHASEKFHPVDPANPTTPNTKGEQRQNASRPVKAGGGVKRGDRRDMNKAYTGNEKHAARGNTPRVNVATRKD